MSEKPDSYETAVERLEQIIDRLDSGQAGLRETLDLCKEGRELVTYCAAELDAVGEGLKELKLDELAEKLDASAGGLIRSRRPRRSPPPAGGRPASTSAPDQSSTTGSSGRSRKT